MPETDQSTPPTPRRRRGSISLIRFLVLIPALGMMLSAVTLIMVGAVLVVDAVLGATRGQAGAKDFVLASVEIADMFLLAVVLLIIGIGLYELFIGEVRGRNCILIDDIVDSAGTLCNAAKALLEAGASSVAAYATHGVLSGGAVSRVSSSPIETLIITDSITATEAVRVAHNIEQVSIAPLMAEAMLRISEETSVSSLFD